MSATPLESFGEDPQRSGDEGAVLIVVLGAMLLLSAIASTLMLATRSELKARFEAGRSVELSLIADGMVRLTAYQLTRRSGEEKATALVDGTPRSCTVGEDIVEVRVVDAAGLVDLNAAPLQLVERALLAAGASPAIAKSMAARIQDFRDADDVETPGGAETATYAAQGMRHGPKNAPFDTVEELDQVLGMSPELLEALRPLVTVQSRFAGIDPAVTPLPLLRALVKDAGTAVAGDAERALLSQRYQLDGSTTALSQHRSYHVQATVRRMRSNFTRFAVIELAPRSESGFVIQSWRLGGAGHDAGMTVVPAPCFVVPP